MWRSFLNEVAAMNGTPLWEMGAGARPDLSSRECWAFLEFSRHSFVSWAKQM